MTNMKIVVTGGGGDIASAIGVELTSLGNEVYLPDRLELDVGSLESVERYFEDKKIDVLINNAGYIFPNEVSREALSEDLRTIDVNLCGVIRCTSIALANNSDLIIVNIGSSAGSKSRGSWGSYCASKAAVIMLTKCWADEGIRVYCLSPGRTKTKMRNALFGKEDETTLLPPNRFARVVAFAVGGKFTRGSNIDVNANNVGEIIEKHC